MLPVLASMLLVSATLQPGPVGQVYTSNVDLRDPSKEVGIISIVYSSGLVESAPMTPLIPIRLSGTQIHLYQVGALLGRPALFLKDPAGVIIEVQIQ